jgi:DNA-binding NarL/FixJ family response regulator
MIRIILADDHPIVLNGLEGMFALERDIEVIAKCVDGEEALTAVRTLRPDVVVADLQMPKVDGLGVARAIASEALGTKVVILSAEISDDKMVEGLRLGIKGLILKETAPQTIVACVRRVHSGGQWLESAATGRAIETLLRRETATRELATALTAREMELVRLAGQGMRNKEISERLTIGEGTVKAHLHNVYRKLGIESRVELVLYARERGIA